MELSLKKVFKEVDKNYKIIEKTYKILEKTYELKLPIHSAGQWLLDNMYIIDEEYELLKDSKSSLKYKKLPAIITNEGSKCISIYYLAYELVENNTGYLDENIITKCLKEHQKISYLKSEEIDLFLIMLKLSLFKFITRICLNIMNSQEEKMNVENIISAEFKNNNLAKKIYNEFKYFNNIKDYMVDNTKIKSTNTAFVEYMAYRLKEMGQQGEKYFELLSHEALKIGFTVDEAIVKEHMEIAKTTEYIGRAISSFKKLQGINFRKIFEKVNKIDETLKNDYTNEFEKCDYKTKQLYRGYIIYLSKKYKLSEVYVAKKAIDCSNKYKKHVGFFLIGDKKYLLKKELNKPYVLKNYFGKIFEAVKPTIYILSLIILSILITFIIGHYFIKFDMWINIISYIILFALSMEISDKIVNYIIRKNVPAKILPRFDFSKSIDEKNSTYVVMPTVISSLNKLDEMINKMEVTYLANRSDNMYYMLLGDCIGADKPVIDIDEKIVKYAKEKLDKLNEKYPSNHKIFNFMYRKRIYSKGEGTYMGYERKRGGLLHFNELVLGKLSKEEIDKKMYLTYDDIINAKYAITLDEDSFLSLNTAKDLVAIISHPLNQPILSKNKKIVKKGYGLIQPSVGIDIEAANKSIFSKIFGGFGGLDIYTNAISNTYQDLFNEAIFCGKGIYNIELFEKLVANEIPENLVLSHDLLEGSIIKAGLASDVELQDGFPNNYIAYMKRNHRWYRGDMQIVKWLINPKSKLSILSKWKIFDNLRRPMVDVFSILAILLAAIFIPEKIIAVTLFSFITLNFGYLISIVEMLIYGKIKYSKDLQYIPLIHGISACFLNMCFNFVTLPYKAYTCLSAFSLSIYRMLVSKKNLLQWTTGEKLEKNAKSNLKYYYSNMMINIIVAIIILAFNYFNLTNIRNFYFNIFLAISFISAPLLAFLLGKDHLFGRRKKLNKKQDEEIMEIAKRTWKFFDSNMNELNNYLPIDNYQENRKFKIASRTSSTDIGFGILSIINAYDLKLINMDDTINKLDKLYNTLKKLDKWNGHLFNWYNTKTLEPLRPRFVSTVDSGNFVASLYVAKQFLINIKKEELNYNNKIDELINLTEELIKNTNFSKLYCYSRNLFSIGYSQEAGYLVDSYYDMLLSESRILSLIAIAKREVTSKHWFSLGRNLVKADGYKGLMSWTGTAFEAFMPCIFTKSYEHTLIDQSLFFNEYSQIKYGKINNVPWGVSESAYAVKDNNLNYQYKAFGIPWLGLKRGLNDNLVISPYSTILMLDYDPQNVYKNIQKLKEIGLYSTYGFYESIDYTKQNLSNDSDYEIIKTYMAHHQGMILATINNYKNNGIIRERFHNNCEIKASEILLKERERLKANIKKQLKDKQNVFKQQDIKKYTTYVNCTYANKEYATENDASTRTALALLKGANTSVILSNKGAEYIKYKNKIVNKQRFKDPETTGNYVYITDKTNGAVFDVSNCNIHSIYNKNTNKCNWVNNLNGVECFLETDSLEITTNITLSQEYDAVIKKVSLYNNSNKRINITINTFLEPALTDYMTNVVHPSFSNLLIETTYDKDLDILVATKRKKTEDEANMFVYAKLVGEGLNKKIETEKQKIFNNYGNAYDDEISKYPLWPALSYQSDISLESYERYTFYYIVGISDNKYLMNKSALKFDKRGIEEQIKLSGEINSVVARYLKLEPTRAEVYNDIIKDALFSNDIQNDEKYWDTSLSQNLLWKYSISGDFPIILTYIDKIEKTGIVKELINFMDYVKNRRINLDIVILINEKEEKGPIYTYIRSRLDRAVYMDYTKGNIYILNLKDLTKQEVTLLSFLSKKYINDIKELLCVNPLDDESSTELLDIKEKSFENKGEDI